jgi:hypothetical protein
MADDAHDQSAVDHAELELHNFHARLPLLSAKTRAAYGFCGRFCLSLTFN